MIYLLSGLVLISCLLNAYLFRKLHSSKSTRETYEVRDLLHDLTSPGGAVLQIKVIDKASIFLRAPQR